MYFNRNTDITIVFVKTLVAIEEERMEVIIFSLDLPNRLVLVEYINLKF